VRPRAGGGGRAGPRAARPWPADYGEPRPGWGGGNGRFPGWGGGPAFAPHKKQKQFIFSIFFSLPLRPSRPQRNLGFVGGKGGTQGGGPRGPNKVGPGLSGRGGIKPSWAAGQPGLGGARSRARRAGGRQGGGGAVLYSGGGRITPGRVGGGGPWEGEKRGRGQLFPGWGRGGLGIGVGGPGVSFPGQKKGGGGGGGEHAAASEKIWGLPGARPGLGHGFEHGGGVGGPGRRGAAGFPVGGFCDGPFRLPAAGEGDGRLGGGQKAAARGGGGGAFLGLVGVFLSGRPGGTGKATKKPGHLAGGRGFWGGRKDQGAGTRRPKLQPGGGGGGLIGPYLGEDHGCRVWGSEGGKGKNPGGGRPQGKIPWGASGSIFSPGGGGLGGGNHPGGGGGPLGRGEHGQDGGPLAGPNASFYCGLGGGGPGGALPAPWRKTGLEGPRLREGRGKAGGRKKRARLQRHFGGPRGGVGINREEKVPGFCGGLGGGLWEEFFFFFFPGEGGGGGRVFGGTHWPGRVRGGPAPNGRGGGGWGTGWGAGREKRGGLSLGGGAGALGQGGQRGAPPPVWAGRGGTGLAPVLGGRVAGCNGHPGAGQLPVSGPPGNSYRGPGQAILDHHFLAGGHGEFSLWGGKGGALT